MIYLETSEKEVAFTWVGRLFADTLIILFVFQMSLPLLIALVLAIKAFGSALLLRIKQQVVAPHLRGAMSLLRRGLGCLFEEPNDAAHLRHMAYEKFSTLLGMTNVLYGHN